MGALISEVVLVAFEGPDRYAFVGGLATRMNDLAEALTARGHPVRHLFVGDPALPAVEVRSDSSQFRIRRCLDQGARSRRVRR